jgi:adenosylmethionine-8-amino-7-oxononanoate aminotransferase
VLGTIKPKCILDTVTAFMAETISGTTLGCVRAVPGYFKAVRDICDKYGALLILDEVNCVVTWGTLYYS